MAGSTTSRSLQDTPTWALAVVCFVLITISIALEYSIHLVDRWLRRHRKKALSDALEKLKAELMLVGFISLLLTVTQRPISKICIPTKVAQTMLPCHMNPKTTGKLGIYENSIHRLLEASESGANGHCESVGKVSLISQNGILELHRFIFTLAATHVICSVFTMVLGGAKMRRWKVWEEETQTTEYLASNDPNRFRFTKQTTFGRRHMDLWTETSLYLWIKGFFRQFFHSVAKVDYLTLRHGFITRHNSMGTFNFQEYIQRSLEDDFKVVVGISPPLWLGVVAFLLVDVHGWNVYLWLSFLPLIIVLALGTKLEVIVTRMALHMKNESSVISGSPLVQPNDGLFWFGHPRMLLHFLHFTLFLNAFEIAFFIWISYEFGFESCYHENIEILVTRVVLAIVVQVICSYITLPLYALITQMGSNYKSAILEEQTTSALKKWLRGVKENRRKQHKEHQQEISHPQSDGSSTNVQVSSPRLTPSPTLSNFVPTLNITTNQDIIELAEEGPLTRNNKGATLALGA